MKLSRLTKIATGILLTVTVALPQILPQTAFAVSSSSLYKLYGQVNPIVEQSSSTIYKIDSGGMPIAGESTTGTYYEVQQGSIYSWDTGVTSVITGGSPLPRGGTPLPGVAAPSPAEIGILDLEFTEIAPDRVKIVFNTDDLAVAHLQYNESNLTPESILEFALKLQHEFVLEDLTPGTTYKFVIKLRDVHFNITESGEFVFTTPTLGYKYFVDVMNDQWFAPYVNALVTAGCLDTVDDYYYPADDLTRAHAVKMLVRAGGLEAGVPGHPTFKDVYLGHWSYPYVEIAYTHNVIDGYSGDRAGYFGPDDSITREQFAKMISETFNLPIMDVCNMFGDSNAISHWACEFVGTAYAWSIVDGYPDGTYGPGRHINRAEGAKMIANGANPVLRAGVDIVVTEVETEGGVIGQGINIDVEAEIVEGGVIGEGLDVGDAPETVTPPVSGDEVVEIEIELGPGGELDYGLVDGTTGDAEELSDVMDYLLEALQRALEGQ